MPENGRQDLIETWTSKLKVGKEGDDGPLASALSLEDFGRLHGQVMKAFRDIYLGLADEADRSSSVD